MIGPDQRYESQPEQLALGGIPQHARPESTHEARRRREVASADIRELELQRRRGELVSAVEVRQTWLALADLLREKALALPEKLAPQLAAVTDEKLVRDMLKREIRSWLQGLSGEVANDA